MSTYLAQARAIQQFTLRELGYLGEAAECRSAPYLSYRRSDREPEWVDLWYQASQIGADAALLQVDTELGQCTIEKAAAFLDRMQAGFGQPGYLARGRPDASMFLRPDQYCDDHGHAGLMLLEAFDATGDEQYMRRAARMAEFLIKGRVWDQEFGGGFWWNSRRGDTVDGKPAQTNGLAADLFLRLNIATGKRIYRDWGIKTLEWLESRLFDASAGLYRWSVAFEHPESRSGQTIAERYFNYDQGIVIEALIAAERVLGASSGYLARAKSLASLLETAFWHHGEGGFNLEHGRELVYAIYSAWLTPSLLALFEFDPDPGWLELARRNVDALRRYLQAPDQGYYLLAEDQNGRWTVDQTRDAAANAGMQRAFALLARVDP